MLLKVSFGAGGVARRAWSTEFKPQYHHPKNIFVKMFSEKPDSYFTLRNLFTDKA
jgi:hypothetical protein